jgi:hypothetical protein
MLTKTSKPEEQKTLSLERKLQENSLFIFQSSTFLSFFFDRQHSRPRDRVSMGKNIALKCNVFFFNFSWVGFAEAHHAHFVQDFGAQTECQL